MAPETRRVRKPTVDHDALRERRGKGSEREVREKRGWRGTGVGKISWSQDQIEGLGSFDS